MTTGETERALRAATCEGCKQGIPIEISAGYPSHRNTQAAMICQSKHAELLPLFNAGIAGAYAAAAKEFPCLGCDAQVFVAPEDRHWTPVIYGKHWKPGHVGDKTLGYIVCPRATILALTPADARLASQQLERMACGHIKADWVERPRTCGPSENCDCKTHGYCRTCAAIASAEADARLETAKLRDALEEIAHEPLGSHATKQVAIEALRDSQVAKSIVDEWREDETGRVYVHKDAILKAINATIWQLTFLLDHSYNVPKDWRKRMAARAPDRKEKSMTTQKLPEQEKCTHCQQFYPKPVELHHTEEECTNNQRTPDSTRPRHTQVGIDGICCSCGYSGEDETPCPKQEDGHHCIHWYEGESPDSTKEPE